MMKTKVIINSLTACLLLYSGGLFAQQVVDIAIMKFKFTPATVTVSPGTTIRWTNKEKRQYHNVWFEALGEEEPDYLFPGDTYERLFEKKGSFHYRCGPHPKMTGVVHVE